MVQSVVRSYFQAMVGHRFAVTVVPALLAGLVFAADSGAQPTTKAQTKPAIVLPPARPEKAVKAAEVDGAIAKAVAYLYSIQTPTGMWDAELDKVENTRTGYTALAVYALLEAGEKSGSPQLSKAIKYLVDTPTESVYALGLRCQVWIRLPNDPVAKRMLQADTNRLLTGLIKKGGGRGMWDYLARKEVAAENDRIDHSVSQYGLLGLWASSQGGTALPAGLWATFDEAWRSHQNNDGGWDYQGSGRSGTSTVPMSAAGVATLMIVQEMLGSTKPDPAIDKGIAYLARNFENVHDNYAWYGIERIGTAGGLKYFGRMDWYGLGARKIIDRQSEKGEWSSSGHGSASSETALALLFLCHGRAPVLMSKLNYSGIIGGTARESNWNQRPRDAANLVKFIAHSMEIRYNWQVVNLSASAEELLESPVLFLSGEKTIVFTAAERAKLRRYVEGGGLIFAVSEAPPSTTAKPGEDEFSRSVVALGRQLFNGTFRELPETHSIYTEQQHRGKQWKEKLPVWGLSNGVRELIVLLPYGDVGRAWQTNATTSQPGKFELAANILQYATTRDYTRQRGESNVITPVYPDLMAMVDAKMPEGTVPPLAPTTAPATRAASATSPMTTLPARAVTSPPPATRPATLPEPATQSTTQPATQPASQPALPTGARKLTVGRLRVGENWDPEPGSWRRLASLLANDFKLFIELQPVEPEAEDLRDIKLLHWTGTTAVKLTDVQRATLLAFLNGGGTLVVDAAGGSAAFADSAQAELIAMFNTKTDAIGTILAEDDPLYRLREAKIDKFEYRRYMVGRSTGKLNAPRVRGVDRSGRTLVFFSREDITGGCVGQNTDGILGYTPATATAIMRNIVLTAAKK